MDHTDDSPSKMMPGSQKHSDIEDPPSASPAEAEENALAAEPVDPQVEEDQAPEPPEMLSQIVSFLRTYLVCDDHQLMPPLTVCPGTETAFKTNAGTINSLFINQLLGVSAFDPIFTIS